MRLSRLLLLLLASEGAGFGVSVASTETTQFHINLMCMADD